MSGIAASHHWLWAAGVVHEEGAAWATDSMQLLLFSPLFSITIVSLIIILIITLWQYARTELNVNNREDKNCSCIKPKYVALIIYQNLSLWASSDISYNFTLIIINVFVQYLLCHVYLILWMKFIGKFLAINRGISHLNTVFQHTILGSYWESWYCLEKIYFSLTRRSPLLWWREGVFVGMCWW